MKRFQNNWPSIRYVWAESHMYVAIQVSFFFPSYIIVLSFSRIGGENSLIESEIHS